MDTNYDHNNNILMEDGNNYIKEYNLVQGLNTNVSINYNRPPNTAINTQSITQSHIQSHTQPRTHQQPRSSTISTIPSRPSIPPLSRQNTQFYNILNNNNDILNAEPLPIHNSETV